MPRPKFMRGVYHGSKTPGHGENMNDVLADKVADFSYQSDDLARLITEVWAGTQASLITPEATSTFTPTPAQYGARSTAAKAALTAKGFSLAQPIVITEREYNLGFSLTDAGLSSDIGIVFVVPDQRRPAASTTSLLETAKLLMAVTPHGI